MRPRPVMQQIIGIVAVAACVLVSTNIAHAIWAVEVESKTVPTGATGVTLDVTAYWDQPLTALYVPLVVREVTPGSFWTGQLPQDDPPTAPHGVVWDPIIPGWAVIAKTVVPIDGCATPGNAYDGSSPDNLSISAQGIFGLSAEPTGHTVVTLTFDVTSVPGEFEIDTACATPSINRIYMVDDNFPPQDHGTGPGFDHFSKGTVTVFSSTLGDKVINPFVISSLPYNDAGTTVGFADDYYENCGLSNSGSNDVVYAYTPAFDVFIDISLCNSFYDTYLFVYKGAVTPGMPYACNDDNNNCAGIIQSNLKYLYLEGGTTYYFVVDGFSTSGNYNIAVTETTTPPEGENVHNPFVINKLPYSDVGNAAVFNDDYWEGCNGSHPDPSRDVVYSFAAVADTIVNISLCASPYPSILYLYQGLETSGDPYACNDNGPNCPAGQPELDHLFLAGGNTYYMVIEAGGPGYEISVSYPDYFTELFTPAPPKNQGKAQKGAAEAQGTGDLSYQTLTFTPDGSADFYTVDCAKPITFFPSPAGGNVLTLQDDDFAEVTIGPSVSLYGSSYTTFYIGSNGYITFFSGKTDWAESLDNHFIQPAISGLFDDLSPNDGGAITWVELPDRLAVTWIDVPEFGPGNQNSFQIEMFFDGIIRITYLGIDATDGLAGLSAGQGVPAYFTPSDLSNHGDCACDCPYQCDYNEDDFLTSLDLGFLIDVLFAGATESQDPLCPGSRGDFNNDGFPTSSDLGSLIDYLFAGQPGPCDPCNPVQSTCTP